MDFKGKFGYFGCLNIKSKRGQEHDSQGEVKDYLCFVNATMSGLKVATLINISAFHNYLS